MGPRALTAYEVMKFRWEVIMRVTSNGKVHRTIGEWREIFSRCEESGLRPREFCQKELIQWASFIRWQRKLNTTKTSNGFVQVKTLAPPSSSWTLEITLPNSIELRFRG